MSNEYENGFTPEENKNAENQNPNYGVNSGTNAGGTAPNYGTGTAPNDNGTTYHYAYSSAGQNNTNYYKAPEQPPTQPEKKHKKPKKQKAVEYDANGNPIKPKKNKTAIAIIVIIAVCVIAAVVGIIVSVAGNAHRKTQHLLPAYSCRTATAMLPPRITTAIIPLPALRKTALIPALASPFIRSPAPTVTFTVTAAEILIPPVSRLFPAKDPASLCWRTATTRIS